MGGGGEGGEEEEEEEEELRSLVSYLLIWHLPRKHHHIVLAVFKNRCDDAPSQCWRCATSNCHANHGFDWEVYI